jgi:hypothetical protein
MTGMGPGKGVKRRCKAAGTALTVLFVAQALGTGVVWSQEPASPNEDELAKQQGIYRSQGDAVPQGYITGRALLDYAEALPSGFCGALGRLRSSDRWLDVGAGAGHAILDYYAPDGKAALTAQCAGTGSRAARAVALSLEDRRTGAWQEQSAKLGDDRIRYLAGKPLRQYSVKELGKFQLITDVYGAFSYTENLSAFMESVLSLLETDGAFFSLLQNVRLESGKEKHDAWYQTELVDAADRNVKVCSWLKQSACVQVTCESKTDWESPSELIHIRKVCNEVSLPRVQLLKFEAGSPPTRRFRLDTQRPDKNGALVPVRTP